MIERFSVFHHSCHVIAVRCMDSHVGVVNRDKPLQRSQQSRRRSDQSPVILAWQAEHVIRLELFSQVNGVRKHEYRIATFMRLVPTRCARP